MITFKSVTKQFQPGTSGVFDVSFTVKPGEMVFITGPSGSGKTTLMRLLTREYQPSSGDIEFQGESLSQLPDRKLHTHRRKIGVVFQDYRLLPELNVWENIALPLSIIGKPQSEIEQRVTDLLKLIQLTNKAELFPRQLSGGEAQRISIARALAIAPTVICADEPTGNLDRDTATNIAHLLYTINKLGTTVLFATHDPHIISLFADKRRINLEDGKLTLDTHTEDQAAETNTSERPAQESKKAAKSEKHTKPTVVKPASDAQAEVPTTTESSSDGAETHDQPGFFARWFGKKSQTHSEKLNDSTQPNQPTADASHSEEKVPPSQKSGKTKLPVKVTVEGLDEEDEL